MLFVLDSTISNLDISCDRSGRALETLLGAYQQRSHLLFGRMPDIARLIEIAGPILSRSSLAGLRALYGSVVENKALVDEIGFRVIVYVEDCDRSGISRDGNCWNVPIKFFADAGLLQSTVLCENELDAELYVQFAEAYCFKRSIKIFQPKARQRGGGGSGLPIALGHYLRSEISPCVCFTDSDKYAPHRPQSETSRRCVEIVGDARARVAEHFSLHSREAENIIPIELLRKVCEIDGFMRKVRCAPSNQSTTAWDFLDLKNGFTLDWFEKQDAHTQQYWRALGAGLTERRQKCLICVDQDRDCACAVIPGLGAKVLAKVVGYLRDNPPRVIGKLLNDDLRWEAVGKIVYDFSVAPGGMPAVR